MFFVDTYMYGVTMTFSSIAIPLAAIVSATFTIRARERDTKSMLYFFKPLTTILIILMAYHMGPPEWTPYFYWLLAGLVFCLFGDIFLMFPDRMFMHALVAFLIGQVLYTLAFTSGIGFGFSLYFVVPLLLYGILIFIVLLPHLQGLRLPVLLYIIIICCMAWQAWERWQRVGGTRTFLAAVGAVIFMISDTVMAMNRFRKPFTRAHTMSLSAYYLAQWFIALSAGQ